MRNYYSFLIPQRDKAYDFKFLPICTHCGRSTDQTTKVEVEEMMGLVRVSANFRVPYCEEHLAVLRTYTAIKFVIYLISFLLTVIPLLFLNFRSIFLAIMLGIIVWDIIIFRLFKYLIVKPLLKILDKDHIYEYDTNTLSFTARLEMGGLVVGFLNPAIAQKFAMANWKNPLIKPREGSVASMILREVTGTQAPK